MQLSARPNPSPTSGTNTSSLTVDYENDVFTVSQTDSPYFAGPQGSAPGVVRIEPPLTIKDSENRTNPPYYAGGQGSAAPGVVRSEPLTVKASENRTQEKPDRSGTKNSTSPQKPESGNKNTPQSLGLAPIGNPGDDPVDSYSAYIRTMCTAAQEVRDETKDRELTCIDCGKTFETWTQLKRHLGTHAETKPYMCDECERGFTDSNKLKRHKLTHTGVKPYQCTICDQRVSRPEHLRRHMFTHVEEKPYQCSACDYKGRRPERVKKHQRKCHMDQPNVTVISLDVKVPWSSPEPSLDLSSYVKNVCEKEMKTVKTKKRKEPPLPTMVAPEISFPHPAVTESGGPPGVVSAVPADCGPVFPGQISPRTKHPEPVQSPPAKKLKTSPSPGEGHGGGEGHGAGNTPGSERTSSQRKSAPLKMARESPVQSFEGGGASDFSSVGIPARYTEKTYNNQYRAAPAMSSAPPLAPVQTGNQMTSHGYGHMTSGLMPPPGGPSGHMVYGVFLDNMHGSRPGHQMAGRAVASGNPHYMQQAPSGAESVMYRQAKPNYR